VAGGAAEVLPVPLNCPLPLRRTHPPTLVCCFCVFAAMGVTSTKSGRLEVNLSLSGKRVGRAIWEQFYFQLFQESGGFAWSSVRCCLYLWRQCMILRSLFSGSPKDHAACYVVSFGDQYLLSIFILTSLALLSNLTCIRQFLFPCFGL